MKLFVLFFLALGIASQAQADTKKPDPKVEVIPLTPDADLSAMKGKDTKVRNYNPPQNRTLPFTTKQRDSLFEKAELTADLNSYDDFKKDELMLRAMNLDSKQLVKKYPTLNAAKLEKLSALSKGGQS